MTDTKEQTPSNLDSQLLARLEKCTNLPSPPGVALRIIDLAKDPDVDIGDVADVVSVDPALTAKILRVTNSPFYARRREIENLHQAITLLGLNGTLSLALSFSLASAMQGTETQGFDYTLYWKRSLAVATCARRLGTALELGGNDDLFVAGLLQDIGMLALDKVDPEFYPSIDVNQSDQDALLKSERERLGADHAVIGAWLLGEWGLPKLLQIAVQGSHDPSVVECDKQLIKFVQCVALAGRLIDLVGSDDCAKAFENAIEPAREWFGFEESDVSAVLVSLNEDMEQASVQFETNLDDYNFAEGVLDQAKETLMMRNLQTIQHSDNLQETTEELESRTRSLEEKARRDGLTGLYNRAYFDQKLEREFSVAKKQYWPMTLIFADLDFFKQVNDTHGHAAGDQVIRNAAEILEDGTRDTDIVARYGGEEFVIVLPGTGRDRAHIISDRLTAAFRHHLHRVSEEKEIVVTISLGIAVQDERTDFSDPKALTAAADRALYAAKDRGRDRAVMYDGSMNNAEENLVDMVEAETEQTKSA